jgi:putative hydrolase of HD superfamily
MIKKVFFEFLFDAANMQRWNDHIRPVDLNELDKQAHKMIIAFVLGKFAEEAGIAGFSWKRIIEGGIYELFQRIVTTDIKPELHRQIKKDRKKYSQLNKWIFSQIREAFESVDKDFADGFIKYFTDDDDGINRQILSAAHFYSTKWEFNVIEKFNADSFRIEKVKERMTARQEQFYHLEGIRQLELYAKLRNFIDICGQLRFQIRWSHMHRVPKTSVLGHMLTVAVMSYVFSLKMGSCQRRAYNNFFGGLFHDLPEILTRDIVSPVKMSIKGLSAIIKKYEKSEMSDKVFSLLPEAWHKEMRYFTENEFKSAIIEDGKRRSVGSDEISSSFNFDKYNPKDGEIIRVSDHLSALIEAWLALNSGIRNKTFKDALEKLLKEHKKTRISGINFGKIFKQFDF